MSIIEARKAIYIFSIKIISGFMNWLKIDVKNRIILGFTIEAVIPTKNGFLYISFLFFKAWGFILKVNI